MTDPSRSPSAGLRIASIAGVPVYLGDIIQATLLLVTLGVLLLQRYRIRWGR